jgi:hypothetical protein
MVTNSREYFCIGFDLREEPRKQIGGDKFRADVGCERAGIPDCNQIEKRSRRQPLPIRAERHAKNDARIGFESLQLLPGRKVPNSDSLVISA